MGLRGGIYSTQNELCSGPRGAWVIDSNISANNSFRVTDSKKYPIEEEFVRELFSADGLNVIAGPTGSGKPPL
jgi:predicted TPR repeat methyltransferase